MSNPMSGNRFHDITIDDLRTLRAALVRWLPERAQAVVDATRAPEEGASFDYLVDAVRLIRELDHTIAIKEEKPLIDATALEEAEDLQKMYDHLPRQDD
jgi:hypothetical protein